MGFNTAQQFDPNTPALAGRGAYGIPPIPGSSNLFGASIPGTSLAGKFSGLLSPQAFEEIAKKDPSGAAFLQIALNQYEQNTPEARAAERKQAMQDAAAFYKEQGDQQMKYNLINRGLTALPTGIERGLTQYQDPYSIANMIANGYAEGTRSSAGLAQLGAGIPATKYYRV